MVVPPAERGQDHLVDVIEALRRRARRPRADALFGWWWADPVAALGVVVLLVREGREAISADHVDDCC